jgi:regulatory protein
MPVITGIKQQKKKDRVNVYLDGKFGFGIDLDNFVLLGLKDGQELTQARIEEVVKKAEFQKTWEKLLRFAMTRPRSHKEVSMWFRKKEVHESIQAELINKLKHFDMLDDAKFAKWWVEQRQNFKPKPRRVLLQELKIKGISQENINLALGEEVIDEVKMAQKILQKKDYKWQGLDPKVARLKKSTYLAGKGFGWEVIEKILKKIESEDSE